MSAAPPNSAKQTTAEIIGGTYNATPLVLVDGQSSALQLDVNGKLVTSGSGGGGGNVNITGINGTPPAMSNPLPVELSDGTNPFGTPGNPLSVNVITGGGSNASVGATGSAAPTSATEMGIIVAGLLQGVSAANPLPISLAAETTKVIGTTRTLGNAGAVLDVVLGAAKAPNLLQVGGNDGTNAFALPLVSGGGAVVDNVAQWGGTVVSAPPATTVPATGAEVAPVVKPLTRKATQILTQTPLASLGNFTSAWFDSNATGDTAVTAVQTNSTVGGSGTNQFQIQGSNDIVTPGPTISLQTMTAVGTSASINVLQTYVHTRYWRIVYTNGATTQVGGTMEISVTSSNYVTDVVVKTPSIPLAINQLQATLAPGSNLVQVTTDGQSSFKMLSQDNTFAGVPGVMSLVSTGTFAAFWQRTPAIFKTASVAATVTGNSAVWTPAAGKKFRLMRFQITAQGLAATATGVVTISFQDNVTGITIGTYDIDVPAVAGVVSGVSNISCGWIDLGNGFLSAAANNVLNFNISAAGAGTVGTYRINVCGTEE